MTLPPRPPAHPGGRQAESFRAPGRFSGPTTPGAQAQRTLEPERQRGQRGFRKLMIHAADDAAPQKPSCGGTIRITFQDMWDTPEESLHEHGTV